MDWRRSGEAWGSVAKALWRERAKADDFVRPGTNVREWRCFRRRRNSSGDELAESAVVFLMYARTPGCSMGLGVRLYRGGHDTSRCRCIYDTGDAWQKRLGEGADDYPTANCSRESYCWCHVTWVRTLTALECNDHSRSDQDAQPSARSFVLARVARTVEKTFVFE